MEEERPMETLVVALIIHAASFLNQSMQLSLHNNPHAPQATETN
jgi:hypothetical protein